MAPISLFSDYIRASLTHVTCRATAYERRKEIRAHHVVKHCERHSIRARKHDNEIFYVQGHKTFTKIQQKLYVTHLLTHLFDSIDNRCEKEKTLLLTLIQHFVLSRHSQISIIHGDKCIYILSKIEMDRFFYLSPNRISLLMRNWLVSSYIYVSVIPE